MIMARDKVIAPPAAAPKPSPESDAAPTASAPEWLEVSGLDKPQAEQLLDWLEVHGFEQRQIVMGPDDLFVVRYRPRRPL
jgi:hypothetical protein